MVDATVKPALRAALRAHEIGSQSPYQLFFAKKANSGGSFGFMQGDLATGQPHVQSTFTTCLSTAGFAQNRIASITQALSVHVENNPLSTTDTQQVNAALDAGRARVDAMDEAILQDVYDNLDLCTQAASSAQRTIDPKALIFMAMWINMSGRPTKLLDWLRGNDPQLGAQVPQPSDVVEAGDMETYLSATKYYRENPGNIPHLLQSAATGFAQLP